MFAKDFCSWKNSALMTDDIVCGIRPIEFEGELLGAIVSFACEHLARQSALGTDFRGSPTPAPLTKFSISEDDWDCRMLTCRRPS